MPGKPRLLKLAPVTPDPEPTWAARVTGHNLANITYLVSKAAERGRYAFQFKCSFTEDGSLTHVQIPGSDNGDSFSLIAGTWVFLKPGAKHLEWGAGHPVQLGHFREIA